ncbi:GreA/GreB family elongation factor [Candidatus Nomurabacteria bacterium]|nr:GreA/GreB family elongation factor [Candidatus Nomurabacteria bacterium]
MTNKSTVVLLSKKGMKELKKSISKLERAQTKTLQQLHELEKGDSHEERLARVEKLAEIEIIETDLADKRRTLKSARLYPRKRDALKVALGSVVDLIDTQGKIVRYTIVESIEANPSDGRISSESPLGKTLMGRTISETIQWGSRLGTRQMQLVSIS